MRVIDLIAVALSALLVSCESSEPVRDMFDERLKRIQTHGYPTASLSTTPQVSQLGGGAAILRWRGSKWVRQLRVFKRTSRQRGNAVFGREGL